MPITIRFGNTTSTPVQAQIVQDASETSVGVMTKAQAKKLASLGPGGGMEWTVVAVQRRDYEAAVGELVPVDSGEVPVTVTLPSSTPANKGDQVNVKSVSDIASDVTVNAAGGQTIDSAATFVFNGARIFESVIFVSNGSGWDIGYIYPGFASI